MLLPEKDWTTARTLYVLASLCIQPCQSHCEVPPALRTTTFQPGNWAWSRAARWALDCRSSESP
jgi:hypothetical protein